MVINETKIFLEKRNVLKCQLVRMKMMRVRTNPKSFL